jgi:hypothetical protein
MSDGDDTCDESVESEWDDDDHSTDGEEEDDSENGSLCLASELTSLYYRQLPLYST